VTLGALLLALRVILRKVEGRESTGTRDRVPFFIVETHQEHSSESTSRVAYVFLFLSNACQRPGT